MITKEEIYRAGLYPVKEDMTGFGCDGAYANAVTYKGIGNGDLFYKLELRQEPIPPNTSSADTWITCFTADHLVEVLKSYTYYETLRKVKTSAIEPDDELTDLWVKYGMLFNISWTEFLELPIEQVRNLINASVGDSDWE